MNIAVYNNKGGVGKTTIASALVYVARERGMRVNVVDADPQCNLSQIVSGGSWQGEDYYEIDNNTHLYTTFEGIDSHVLSIVDCPPDFEFIEKLDNIPIHHWIIPIRGRFSIDGVMNVLSQLDKANRSYEKQTIVSNMNTNQGNYGRLQFEEARKLGSELYPYSIARNIAFEKAEDSLRYVFNVPHARQCEAVQVLYKFAQEVLNG